MTQAAPVLEDERTRKGYDTTWSLYPFEHPAAYWLRGGPYGIICTRCGGHEGALADEPAFEAFTTLHLNCKLGHGLRGTRVEHEEDPALSAL